MNRRMKILAGSLAVLMLVTAVGVGSVMAQDATPAPDTSRPMGRGGLFGRGLPCAGSWTTFDATAKALGLTPVELFAELHAGKSVQEIAEAKGIDMDTVNEAIQASQAEARKAAIEQAVKDGKLTREQADWLLKGFDLGMAGRGKGFEQRGRGMPGHHGPGNLRKGPGSSSTAPSVTPSPSSTSM